MSNTTSPDLLVERAQAAGRARAALRRAEELTGPLKKALRRVESGQDDLAEALADAEEAGVDDAAERAERIKHLDETAKWLEEKVELLLLDLYGPEEESGRDDLDEDEDELALDDDGDFDLDDDLDDDDLDL